MKKYLVQFFFSFFFPLWKGEGRVEKKYLCSYTNLLIFQPYVALSTFDKNSFSSENAAEINSFSSREEKWNQKIKLFNSFAWYGRWRIRIPVIMPEWLTVRAKCCSLDLAGDFITSDSCFFFRNFRIPWRFCDHPCEMVLRTCVNYCNKWSHKTYKSRTTAYLCSMCVFLLLWLLHYISRACSLE